MFGILQIALEKRYIPDETAIAEPPISEQIARVNVPQVQKLLIDTHIP